MRRTLSIHLKLLFLVLLASLPALGLAVYSGLMNERRAMDDAQADAHHLTRDLVIRQQMLIESTQQFLATMAKLPQVRAMDGAASAKVFREVLTANHIYSDILLTRPDGVVLASARLDTPRVNLSDADYIRDVLRTREFAVSTYRRSRTTGLDVLVCAQPVLGPRHEVLGVISTGLRLDNFDETMGELSLPEGSMVFLADRLGTRLFHRLFPDADPKTYPPGEPLKLLVHGQLADLEARGAFTARGPDGLERLYFLRGARLSPDRPPMLYVGISLPERSIRKEARRSMFAALSVLSLAALLSALAAWFLGNRLLLARIERLGQVAESYTRGDLTERTGLGEARHGGQPDEITQLARAVDRLGEELSAREAEREATLERLKQTQFAVDNTDDEIYWVGQGGRLLYVNKRAAASLGRSQEELVGVSVYDFDVDITPARLRELLGELEPERPVRFETRHRKSDGSLTAKELQLSMVLSGETRMVFATGRDISARKRQEAVLRSLVDETAPLSGQDFFNAFTSRVAETLNAYAVFVGEYADDPPTRMRTLSVTDRDNHGTGAEFDLDESPGKDIPNSGYLFIPRDARKLYPEATFVQKAGVEAYLGVPLLNTEGKRLGHLSLMNLTPMEEDPQLVSTLRLFAQRAATEVMRLRAERQTLASLREKDMLLKEIHHRVKNNLQVVSSLLVLQARDVTDPAMLDLLRESRDRILSMAMVHEDLYQTGNLAQVDFLHYLRRLAERIRQGHGGEEAARLEFDLQRLSLTIEQAIPLGLLCNELLANAFKHAGGAGAPRGAARGGVVRVVLRRVADTASVSVRDNGPGLPPDFDPAAGESLGLQLVSALAAQLGGELTAESDGGAVFTVRFPVRSGA